MPRYLIDQGSAGLKQDIMDLDGQEAAWKLHKTIQHWEKSFYSFIFWIISLILTWINASLTLQAVRGVI